MARVALVTGGTRGIGAAVSTALKHYRRRADGRRQQRLSASRCPVQQQRSDLFQRVSSSGRRIALKSAFSHGPATAEMSAIDIVSVAAQNRRQAVATSAA